MKSVDVTGVRFGKLTAVSRAGSDGSNAWWNCVCECGSFKEVRLCHLQRGSIKSCGCGPKGRHRSEHGMSDTKLHRIWRYMHQRCENPKNEAYENYGGRGIKVCERWNNFPNFYDDMGDIPGEGYTLDRIDVNGNYEPSNCRWATWTEQHNNRRDNHLITAFSRTQTLHQWAKEYNLPVSTLKNRIYRAKMEPEAALQAPLYAQQRGKI